MKETLKRLQDLQRRLEALHRESASLIAESQRLVENVEQEARGIPDPGAQNPKRVPSERRKRTRRRP